MTTPSTAPGEPSWREQRTEAAAHQQRELERRRARESAAARELITNFVTAANNAGIAPVPLRAKAFSGSATYRTTLSGWYLRKNQSVAVGTDGEFYILSVPGGLVSRLRGATPEPSAPPLVLGAGGRDGESIDLADALDAVLRG